MFIFAAYKSQNCTNRAYRSISKEVVSAYENLRHKMEDAESRNKRPKIGVARMQGCLEMTLGDARKRQIVIYMQIK